MVATESRTKNAANGRRMDRLRAGAALGVGVVAVLALTSQAANAADARPYHNLMVRTHASIGSIQVSVNRPSTYKQCRATTHRTQWYDQQVSFGNGSPIDVVLYSDNSCKRWVGSASGNVPHDSLTNFWFDASGIQTH